MDTLPQKVRSGAGDQSTAVVSGLLRRARRPWRGPPRSPEVHLPHLAAKEERLEDHLWAAAQSMQEVADLMRDLAGYAERLGSGRPTGRLWSVASRLRSRATRCGAS